MHMSDITLRPGRPEDAEPLAALLDASWCTHWAPNVLPQSIEQFDRERPAHDYAHGLVQEFIVAERGGAIVGMYHLEETYLHAIHVAPEAIGSGIGGALMKHAEAHGAKKLEVRSFNRNAIAFYLSRGWEKLEEVSGSEMGTPTMTIIMIRPD